MILKGVEPLLDLGTLPFHIGVMDTPSNGDLPDSLPFVIGIHPEIGLLTQLPNQYVAWCLENAYRHGSIIGTPMAEVGFGRRYVEDFLGFVMRCWGDVEFNDSRLLEIGCGTGYLLHRFHQLGAHVLGVEPGIEGQKGADRYGIKVVRDVFPGDWLFDMPRFDVIVHYCVMEHIEAPLEFLGTQSQFLTEKGVILLAVPDCREYVCTGDISMFVHEHWNYFTPDSLNALVSMSGLKLLRLEQSGYGNLIYAMLGKSENQPKSLPRSAGDLTGFAERVYGSLDRAKKFFDEIKEDTLGIFVPARAINLLALLQTDISLRFFDDDINLHGKYYPPFDIFVESRSQLVTHPIPDLLIMSRTFGRKLKAALEVEIPKTHIHLIEARF